MKSERRKDAGHAQDSYQIRSATQSSQGLNKAESRDKRRVNNDAARAGTQH